jgi:hypothetical protein
MSDGSEAKGPENPDGRVQMADGREAKVAENKGSLPTINAIKKHTKVQRLPSYLSYLHFIFN